MKHVRNIFLQKKKKILLLNSYFYNYYLEKQADLNCDFENLFICNFRASTAFGGAWQWSAYGNIVSFGDQNGTDPNKPHVISPVDHGIKKDDDDDD